ncbi:hypothetical protein QAD02_023507 [Eretmocerus hayati]|uniref:Uncharacterized protein n=1 Tax=Eretmocerus hayati TaxID=131215 RepID=A0ACC2PW48_9HYME|nr:hypothetical protein QAD02_023507 [Eretmocerus hayati]
MHLEIQHNPTSQAIYTYKDYSISVISKEIADRNHGFKGGGKWGQDIHCIQQQPVIGIERDRPQQHSLRSATLGIKAEPTETGEHQSSNQATAVTMRAFVILALASVAVARPEAGYSYNGPSGGGGGGGGGFNQGGFGGGAPSAPSGSYGTPGFGGNNLGGGSSGGCGFGGSGGAGCGVGSSGPSFGGGSSGPSFGGGSQSGPSFGPGPSGGGGTLIQKHIYVHVPPPEPEEARPQRQFGPAPQAQKHYKIIFIKAPTAPTPTAPVIPQLAQDEQKTLIYVLVKKPEDAPEFTLPTAAPTQPSKPEVYFIKYKTQKEGGANLGPGIGGGHGGLDNGLGGPDSGLGGGLGGPGLGGGPSSGGIGGGPGAGGPSGSYGPPGNSGPY